MPAPRTAQHQQRLGRHSLLQQFDGNEKEASVAIPRKIFGANRKSQKGISETDQMMIKMDLFSDYQAHYKTDNQINSMAQYQKNGLNYK